MNKILFKNAKVVDEDKDIIQDVLVEGSKILKVSENIIDDKAKTIDCNNLTLMPSFVDLHSHFREPGYEYKETLETGSKAAVKGGYTYVNLMGNTNPIASSMKEVDYVLDKIKEIGLINAHQVVSVTKNFDGKTLSHLDDIDENKVKFISDDGRGVISNITSYNSMLIAKKHNFTIMTHAEDMNLTPIDYRISENIITFRDLYLCQVTGARLHLSHVSTKEAIKAIRLAKTNNVNVTAEVTPHHVMLYDNDFRVNPPIRKKEDTEEIIRGIKDGTVDVISGDHAPHSKEDKEKGSPGLPSLETGFAVIYTALVRKNHITLSKLSQIMTANGYRIIGDKYKDYGKIKEGYNADLALIDTEKEWTVRGEDFVSKGKVTPFEGMKLYGKVLMTFKDGKVVYDDHR